MSKDVPSFDVRLWGNVGSNEKRPRRSFGGWPVGVVADVLCLINFVGGAVGLCARPTGSQNISYRTGRSKK